MFVNGVGKDCQESLYKGGGGATFGAFLFLLKGGVMNATRC